MELMILVAKVIVALFLVALHLAAFCTWVERKGSALIQDRIGANRSAAYVQTDNLLLKPVAFFLRIMGGLGVINTLVNDAVKAILKEDFVPAGVPKFVHALAPFLAVFPIFLAYAVVPMAPDFEAFGQVIRLQVASLDAGVLFLFAMGSVSVYGVAMAGWSGNNKFSLLGALRASAQMISYELAMGISLVTVILVYGTLDLYEMVNAQGKLWGICYQPLTFLILFTVGMAETKRGPFDLPESESELVAGYFTEYSGMKFLVFWLGEFAEIGLFALLLTILFFGGWNIPFFTYPSNHWIWAIVGFHVLLLKVVFFCVLQIVIRWTLPRFRYDQLMDLGWKILLPLSMLNLVFYAALKLSGGIG
ncbi:MAG: NADH-quinone oxidoreductase subunit H [Oligoflexia bacterium]|nr:NADH-quinone oxidoreductase subunit H [Oligoflexia bacterium]